MKKVLVSPITNTIYYGAVAESGNGTYVSIGKRENITDDCIGAVFQWFENNLKKDKAITYEISYESSPYKLVLMKKDNSNEIESN